MADAPTIANVAEIVSAYVRGNAVPASELPELIAMISRSIDAMTQIPSLGTTPVITTAKSIQNSLHPDYIVSFLDGRRYKTLKRHLTSNGFTPVQYRSHFGLPADYPMVSANYAAKRAAIARNTGLGLRAA